MSSFYETQQDADIDLGNVADAMDDDDDGDNDNINVTVGRAAGSHPAHFVADKKADKKSKSKNRAVGGGRIFTLNNMSSSDDDDDENTGQVRALSNAAKNVRMKCVATDVWMLFCVGFLCWRLGAIRPTSAGTAAQESVQRLCLEHLQIGQRERSRNRRESERKPADNKHKVTMPRSGAKKCAGSCRAVDNANGVDTASFLLFFLCSFGGTGYRLGQTNDDHVRLADASASASRDNGDPIVLRLWRQGFTINDNELRLYEDQKNREFLEYITKG